MVAPSFHRMIADLIRFNRDARRLLCSEEDPSLGEWLSQRRYSWTITGGSRRYVQALIRPWRERLRLSTPVTEVSRHPGHVMVSSRGCEPKRFDAVVIATHSDQALALLADPGERERELLGAIPYQQNEVVLRTDRSLLPRRRRAWASWNFHLGDGAPGSCTVTYHLRRRLAPARVPLQAPRGLRACNTHARSRRGIAAHYDLGNELSALMLDETSMHSYFPRPGMTLAQASRAKLELVCRELDLRAGDHVLEIGTGWGGFAVHAARTRGCRVTTTTISHAQYEHARKWVQAAGVADRVTVLCEDYRDLHGRYEKLVCIEMIEAVGYRDFDTFFARCSNLLAAHGRMQLQAITIDDRAYAVEKASRSFIRTHIFPGGCLPSLAVITRCVTQRTDMRTLALKDLTPHYAETLRRRRTNFEAATPRLEDLGYDERFRRLWRMYLAYCDAGFTERRIGVMQMTLAKPGWRKYADPTSTYDAPQALVF
jgi:cyclopropane-fatty-acyl-phospholipid synthase